MGNWQERAGKGGVCNFKENYDFYFKWLTNKVMSCFIIKYDKNNEFLSEFNENYCKMNLILDGSICVTDFNNKLYPVIGNLGGEPDEYYCPTIYTIANPILGSKQVKLNETGCVIYNTKVDKYNYCGNSIIYSGGLYDLISQTATLLADNIISINCCQINSRVTAFFTADSEAQAIAGETILKKQYAGKPYQILRQDIIEKININPINNAATANNLTELVELNNYIIANFFQSIGVKSNNVMKRERLINSEIDSQNDYLKVSLLEILTSWQEGFDNVNELYKDYNTDFTVELNPALIDEILEDSTSEEKINGEAFVNDEYETEMYTESTEEQTVSDEYENDGTETDSTGDSTSGTTEEEEKDIIEEIKDNTETISEIVDFINDKPVDEEDATESVDEEDATEEETTDEEEVNEDDDNKQTE